MNCWDLYWVIGLGITGFIAGMNAKECPRNINGYAVAALAGLIWPIAIAGSIIERSSKRDRN